MEFKKLVFACILPILLFGCNDGGTALSASPSFVTNGGESMSLPTFLEVKIRNL